MKAAAIIVGVVIVAVVILVASPAAYSGATGRPIILDCGGLSPELCEEAVAYWGAQEGGIGPITVFVIDSPYGTTCGDVEMARWVLWVQSTFNPLC